MFTIYDYANNSIIYGPLTGHQDSILTEPTKSLSVKIVIVTNVTSSVKQRYAISFKEVPKGKFRLPSINIMIVSHILSSPSFCCSTLPFSCLSFPSCLVFNVPKLCFALHNLAVYLSEF